MASTFADSDTARRMLIVRTFGEAIDRYMGELSRRGKSRATRDAYYRLLVHLSQHVAPRDPWELDTDDCRAFLDRWADAKSATMARQISILNGFYGWLADEGAIDKDPMQRIHRPKVPHSDDRDVTTIGTSDVRQMLAAAQSWPEILCMGVLAYTGCRRRAASNLKWRDVDMERGTIRFREKGGKVIAKPMPQELYGVLRSAQAELQPTADDFVIPNLDPSKIRRPAGDRSDKVIWHIVRTLAARAGVKSHVHAIRAAFAVHYLESNEGRIEALQTLMGHSRIETTLVYLRRLDRQQAMNSVRTLSWAEPDENEDTRYQIRTGATAVRGRRPRPLDEPGASDMVEELAAARRPQFPAEKPDVFESSRLPRPRGLEPVFDSDGDADSIADNRNGPAESTASPLAPLPPKGSPPGVTTDGDETLNPPPDA